MYTAETNQKGKDLSPSELGSGILHPLRFLIIDIRLQDLLRGWRWPVALGCRSFVGLRALQLRVPVQICVLRKIADEEFPKRQNDIEDLLAGRHDVLGRQEEAVAPAVAQFDLVGVVCV